MNDFPFSLIGFDLDGTLVETKEDLRQAVNHALSSIGRPAVPEDEVTSLIGAGSRNMLLRALERTGGAVGEKEFAELYSRLIAYYEANISVHSRPYDGCLKALDELAGLGCALSVVTNKPEHLARKLLAELNMTDRFACILGGDTLGHGRAKPQPDMIEEAIRQTGPDGRFAMVGDSSFDINAARAAGVASIALSFGYHDMPVPELGADAVVDHYDDLLEALASIGR